MAKDLTDRETMVRRFIEGSLTGDVDSVAQTVTDGVVGWSPQLFVTSRDELLNDIGERDGMLSEVDMFIDVTTCDGKAFSEWWIAGDHTGPLVLNEELRIGPTGRRLHVAGVTVVEFDGDRIGAFRHYFDELALVGQVIGR
jgi:hypothetical protein